MGKERIDVLLARSGLAPSREKARVLVMAGIVYANGQKVLKADTRTDETASLEIRGNPIPYVSFGGVKLKAAIDAFGIDVRGMKVLDVGSSTGGFTDCLLHEGARKIYAIDSGTHQLHEKLRSDRRIILKENFNARYLRFDDIGETVDMITIDVSFISLKKIIPAVVGLVRKGGYVFSLVKPQFEVGRYNVGKGGIVKDDERIKAVIDDIREFGEGLGIKALKIIEVPREKERKNKEYFIVWEKLNGPTG
ncbi:MAG: TlyA family RNA methyltransferase [Syntrophorhabdaceae bacterium]|nr:TlyA family RNA methyltransferase [Syntrophorhabdaceae bacterium]MDD4195908.1 TlyA family RNA methyltransferase [Syntrophorhabdaceae bacterium]HOC46294.1 TlyA family RNA methyltransferase [Syntrophorhabdaceae bacterium]